MSSSIWDSGVQGPPGPPGAKVLLRTTSTFIQYSYEGEGIWYDLVALSTLEGPQGDSIVGPQGPVGPAGQSIVGPPGPAGTNGTNGTDGVAVPTNFGEKVISGNTTPMALVASSDPNLNNLADYVQVAGPWSNGNFNGTTLLPNAVQIIKEGDYLIQTWAAISATAAGGANIAFRASVNGLLVTGRKIWARTDNASDRITLGGFAIRHLFPGDSVSVFVASSVTTDMVVHDADFVVSEILSTQVVVQESAGLMSPLGSISFWAEDSAVPAGGALLNGQELPQASFPDFFASLQAAKLPVVAEATWQADPSQRWKFVVNSSTGKFRLADYNQVAAGSTTKFLPSVGTDGKWIVKLFGTVTNPGSANAAQLATDVANLTSRVSALEAAGPPAFTNSYDSGALAFTAGGLHSLTHGLGKVPKVVVASMICVTPELGYSAGEEILYPGFATDSGGSTGLSVLITGTQILVRMGASNFVILNKATGVTTFFTAANWNIRIRAYA